MDWVVLCKLLGNARASYRDLAQKLGLSPNTVKNRINKLRQQKVILGFVVMVSMEMLNAEIVLGMITTDGSENVIEFMKQIAKEPMVLSIVRASDRRYEVMAVISGAHDTLGFIGFLERLEGVIDVDVKPVVLQFPKYPPTYHYNTRGKKVTFTRTQLQVLRCLTEDARMPVAQIGKCTGFTARRVRKILRELEEGGGIHFAVDYDAFALGDMEYRLIIRFDEAQITGWDLVAWIFEKYPTEFWWTAVVTTEPIVDVGFLIDRPGKSVPIIREIKAAPFVKEIEDFINYPLVVECHIPFRDHLEKILSDAGL